MVVPNKIVEQLGQQLRQRLLTLQSNLGRIQSELSALRDVENVVTRHKELGRRLEELRLNFHRCQQEHAKAQSRENDLLGQLPKAQARLAEAQSSGKLRRLLRRLNPVKLQAHVLKIETDLSIVRRTITEGSSKLGEFQVAIGTSRNQEERAKEEAHTLLARNNVGADQLSACVQELTAQAEELTAAVRAVEAELEVLMAKILREAKLIATSLTKATISKQIDDQKFDVLIVDEGSMAPMPALYFAAGRASQKAIVVGDFRQLPPISVADTDLTKKWLGRDIFNQAGVQQAVDQRKPEPRLTMLRRQYRMHPEISRISNSIIYDDRLRDSLDQDALRRISTFVEQSPFAGSPLILYDVSSTNPWSSRLDQGGRYNLYSAVLSAELAKRAAKAGIQSIGIISPYAVHARLIKMILGDSEDASLRNLKVSTVHRFQGLEQDTIIFDIAEGPMPRYGPSGLVDGTDLASQAAKLINVSITRPRAQLVVVANLTYLTSKLRRDSILVRVLDCIRRRGLVIDSQQIVDDYFCLDFDRWATLLDPHNDNINPEDSALYTERNFYAAFFADLHKAVREIVIVSPFLTASRAQQFLDLLRSKVAAGIEVRVFTRTLNEQQGDMFRQAELVFEGLKQVGAQVVERRGLHQKFAFIDRQIAWEGSLNILSQSDGRSTEHMRRLPFPKTCTELIDIHKFGNDAEVDPGSRRRIQTDRKCEKHGLPMLLVPGPYGPFLGCQKYPECDIHYSIRRGEEVGTDVKCLGKDGASCDRLMIAVRGPYGVYLKDPHCGATRNIGR
jgi:hypothetical protein